MQYNFGDDGIEALMGAPIPTDDKERKIYFTLVIERIRQQYGQEALNQVFLIAQPGALGDWQERINRERKQKAMKDG